MKAEGERYTVAVDFDGVLHSYTSPWIDAETIPDPPVPGAIEWLAEISNSFNVVIFTTRGKTEAGRQAVSLWLLKHGLAEAVKATHKHGDGEVYHTVFDVTAEKPPALIYLDDRAYRFQGPGTFPTKDQIHNARPWNKLRPVSDQSKETRE